MAEYVCPIEGPFDVHAEAAAARTRIAKTPEYYSVAVFKGREKPKLDLERDKYYVCGFRKEPLVPPPAPPAPPAPPEVRKEDFIRDMDLVYKCGGKSEFLNRYCREENVEATLRIDLRVVDEIEGPFDVRPLPRTYEVVVADWKRGKEVARRLHEPTKKWYWVTYPAVLSWVPVVKPPTPMRQAWIDYFKDPDIITAIGLIPSAVQDSFTKVFTGYSIIDDRPAEPEALDYTSVAGIVGGLTLAGIGTVIGALGLPTGAGILAMKATPVVAGATMKGAMLTGAWSKVTKIMLGLLLVSQLDIIAWGFGFAPTKAHDRVDRLIRAARSSVITLDKKVKAEEWASGKTIADSLKVQLGQIEKEMEAFDVKFFEDIGFSVEDLRTTFDTLQAEFQSYLDDYPLLKALPTTFPIEFLIEDAQVEDGDTLIWPGHPEAADRIRIIGIDAHESATEAGIEETEYLKSLIEHHQVKILTHQYHTPEMVIDIYGRLLGGVFLGDQDIALAMLDHFGAAILPAKKYWDKYRWIDWDLYERTAKAAVGPAVKEFKISIDSMPSNAKLFIDDSYTGHLTPSNEKELSDVMHLLAPGEHVFKATKGGKEGSVKATITDGANPAIMITLGVTGLEPAPPEEVPPPEVPPEVPPVEEFSINVDSTPSNAKLFIDDIYTHHWTPMDEEEAKDVMHLLVPGKHTIKVTKAGKEASKEVEILPGFNEPIFLTLGVVGLAPPEVPPEIPPEVPPPEVPPEVPPVEKIDLRLPTPPGATELEGTPWADINHPDIKELAGTLKKETDAETVKAVLEWIWGNITKQPDTWLGTWPGEWRAASQILTYRKGDCSEHSLMVATLCRALGIPAVIYTGKISDLNGANAGSHCWNYVWIDDEWVMVEATSMDGGMGKSHRYYPVGTVINPYIGAPILVDIPYFIFEDRPTKDWTEVEFAEAELKAL